MGKEYWGCAYHTPPTQATANEEDIDVERIRVQVVPYLPGKPVLYEHNMRHVVGFITRAWQTKPDGSLMVAFQLRDTDEGRGVEHNIKTRRTIGLSLGHTFSRTTRDVMPTEVSVVRTGKRPNTVLFNASLMTGMNGVGFTTPAFSLLQPVVPTMQGAFAQLTPDVKAALEVLARQFAAATPPPQPPTEASPPPPPPQPLALQQFNPNVFEHDVQAKQAEQQQQQQLEAYKHALAYVQRFQQQQQQQQPPPEPVVAPMEVAVDTGKTAGKKRSAVEAELDPLRSELENKDKQLKLLQERQAAMATAMFNDIETRIPASLPDRAAVIQRLKSQLDASTNPLDFVQTLKGLYPPLPPSPPSPPPQAQAPVAAPVESPPSLPNVPAGSTAITALASALHQTQMAQQQQQYTQQQQQPQARVPATMQSGGYNAPPSGPLPLPDIGVVQASANKFGAQTTSPLEELLYHYLGGASALVGDKVKRHPTERNGLWMRK
jgi:hypothetical protein